MNPDWNCPTEDGFIPDCGSIKEDEIAIIGDRLYTDIAIGHGNKMVTILVLSGETKLEDVPQSTVKPKMIFKSGSPGRNLSWSSKEPLEQY
ncbi:HAD hydrolase-like protein [Lucifera butyrica]|uniref:HAD hydrolase-like protein n=1 Tax=Lucifera butyrica TaxID=1351585 RepID=UPI000F030447|nr:HAD hydrolase-like protein [Lucifera butyrica]